MPNADTKAKAKTIATRQMLAANREKGFRFTNRALDAVYANSATTQKSIAASFRPSTTNGPTHGFSPMSAVIASR